MTADMSIYREITKRGGDKVGLLGLFVLTVLLAYFTVSLKSAVKLSEPIGLPHTGLSISMPVGNGWYSEKRWTYHDNTFILSSAFALQPNKTTGWAHCQYRLAAKKTPPEDRCVWKASEVDGEIVETARTQTEDLTVEWVRIERPDVPLTTFWGTAELPNGRQLDIEVHQMMSDPELSKRIFNRIVTNLKFTGDPLQAAGAEVVTTMKGKGLNRYLDDQNQRTLYLIKDSTGQPVGFTIEFLVDAAKEARLNVKGAGFLFISGRNMLEQETSFECSNNLNVFTYGNRINSSEGRTATQTALDESGILSVRKFGISPDQKKYYPGSAALPDVFFSHIFQQMLDSDMREIVVDLIDADGKIIPTYITSIAPENPQAAHVFDLELLDGRGFSQRVFLDEQGQIYKSLVKQDSLYVLERTSAEEILREFPERAPRILRNNQTP